MFRANNISIRNKLIFIQVFTSILVLGIFFAVFIVSDMQSFRQRKTESMLGLAQVIGANSVPALQFQDNEAAREMLMELKNVSPEIVYAEIAGKDGNAFASYSKQGGDSLDVPLDLDRRKAVYTKDDLFVSNDIIQNNEVIGKVILEVEMSELSQLKESRYKLATLLLVVALAFTIIMAFIIQRFFSRRLLRLVNNMKEVSRTGDYNKPITDDGRDEISILINVFNNLMLQIKENQQKKDEFISIASHELKTPLTSIKGYLQLLNEIEDRAPNQQFVKKGLDNVRKLERLIRDLLDVSKIQSGQLELNMKDFNMSNLLDESIAATQMVSGTHQILREDELGNEIVAGDRQRIEQVVTNLLSNAIKYSPGEKKIIVSAKKNEKEVIIKVRDFGMGVPKEEQENIFERFYRTKGMTTTITGFGLGLYICRDIIQRHHGKIWVETEEKGSAFYFTLPLKNTPATQKPGSEVDLQLSQDHN